MEIRNGIIYISGSELIKSDTNTTGVLLLNTYMSLKKRKQINVINYGGGGHPALIEYSSLPAKYRAQWEAMHGEPGKAKAFKPFAERLTKDWAARNELAQYRYNGSSTLDETTQESYARDAEIFNAITETLTEMRAARGEARKSMKKSWDLMLSLVDDIREVYTPNNIPTTAITLKRKYERYVIEGYRSLIHKNFGNRNRNKVKDDEAKAVMVRILSDGRRFALPNATKLYNNWATINGRPTMTPRAMGDYLKSNQYLLKASREGNSAWSNEFDQNIRRARPQAPLLLINSDDNNLDFFFKATRQKAVGDKVKTVSTDYYRHKMYLVLDAHNDYVLGYALGDEITMDLVVEAYRNAMLHVKELTGGYYMWHQIVADHWNSAPMKAFLEKQGKTTFAQVGNAKSKYIERFFGTEWHETQKMYNNHSGYNIVAKTKPNSDWIEKNKKNFPTKEEGVAQIAHFIERLRNAECGKDGKTRKQVWLENFFKSERSKANHIDDQIFLDIFGVQRYKKGGDKMEINRITNDGLTITIGGEKYNYSVPQDLYRATLGKEAHTIIDPTDLSRVLVRTTDGKHNFVARQTRIVPSCFADMVAGDMEYWHSQLYIKDERKKAVKAELDTYLDKADSLDIESYMQTGNLSKATNQAMNDAYLSQVIGKESIHNMITS